METYSSWPIESVTPRRTCVGLSAVPRTRWTFWARRRGCEEGDKETRGPGDKETLSRPCPLVPLSPCPLVASSVRPTNHLHRVVLCRPPRGIHRRDHHDDDRADERGVV